MLLPKTCFYKSWIHFLWGGGGSDISITNRLNWRDLVFLWIFMLWNMKIYSWKERTLQYMLWCLTSLKSSVLEYRKLFLAETFLMHICVCLCINIDVQMVWYLGKKYRLFWDHFLNTISSNVFSVLISTSSTVKIMRLLTEIFLSMYFVLNFI